MKRFIYTATICAVLGGYLSSLLFDPAIGQSVASNQNDSLENHYVVLKSGTMFSGTLDMAGGMFLVRKSNGSSIQLDRAEVDFVARSVYEAYVKLKSRIHATDIGAHFDLANWCLRYRDRRAATEQITYFARISDSQRAIETLIKQLESLPLTDRPVKELPADPKSNKPAESNSESATTPAVRELPQPESPEDVMASLTPESLREFNSEVQSRLVNGCAAARCHGNANSKMRLWPSGIRGGLKTTAARRNLQTIMKYVDRVNVLDSKILKYIVTPHGGATKASYSDTSPHYRQIKQWVISTSTYLYADNATQTESADVQAISYQTRQSENQSSVDGESKLTPLFPVAKDALREVESETSEPPSPVDLSTPRRTFVPRDEFDPEIFNREQAAKSLPAKAPKIDETSSTHRIRRLPPSKKTQSLPDVNDRTNR